MDNKVAALAATTDRNTQPQRAPAQQFGRGARSSVEASADLRLIIEETSISGSYVYKTIDRRTGEVVSQFPREQIIRMRDEVDYAAGSVIRAKA